MAQAIPFAIELAASVAAKNHADHEQRKTIASQSSPGLINLSGGSQPSMTALQRALFGISQPFQGTPTVSGSVSGIGGHTGPTGSTGTGMAVPGGVLGSLLRGHEAPNSTDPTSGVSSGSLRGLGNSGSTGNFPTIAPV